MIIVPSNLGFGIGHPLDFKNERVKGILKLLTPSLGDSHSPKLKKIKYLQTGLAERVYIIYCN